MKNVLFSNQVNAFFICMTHPKRLETVCFVSWCVFVTLRGQHTHFQSLNFFFSLLSGWLAFSIKKMIKNVISLNDVDCGLQGKRINNVCCQLCVEENHLVLLNSARALTATIGLIRHGGT